MNLVKNAIFTSIGKLDEKTLAKWIAKSYIDDSVNSGTIIFRIKRFFSSRPELASVYSFLSDLILSSPHAHYDSVCEFLKMQMGIDLFGKSREKALGCLYEALVLEYLPLKSDKVNVRKQKALKLAGHIKVLAFELTEKLSRGLDIIDKIKEE